LLHRDFGEPAIQSGTVTDYYTEPVQRYAKAFKAEESYTNRIVAVLNETAQPGERIPLKFSYNGRLKTEHIRLGGSVISPHWTELQIGAVWLPVGESLRNLFTYEADITLPDNYELVGGGLVNRHGNTFQIRSVAAGPDLPVVISDQFLQKSTKADGAEVDIYHAGAADTVVSFISKHTGQLVTRYNKRFPEGRSYQNLTITIPPLRRARPELYARPGFIGMSYGTETDLNTYKLLVHEIAHLWWSDAVDTQSQHNFRNESFAEYEAFLSVQDEYGSDTFDKYISRVQKELQKLPGFNEWNMQINPPLVRIKGLWLLHQLRMRIGEESFLKFECSLQRKNVGTLDEMLNVLKDPTDEKTATWFEDKLYPNSRRDS